MNTFVPPMDTAEATLAEAGGKGVNLNRLTRAGFPVPPGFLITTTAYRTFVQANNLGASIVALATDKAKTVEEASADICHLFEQGSITNEVASAIQSAYAELLRISGDSTPVAVRSSATAEDLPEASFAGQQESYLNIYGEQAVLEAVKRLLILSGHHDSALENTWLRFLGYGFMPASATLFIGFITLFAMSIIQLAGVITGNAGIVRTGTLGWVLLVYPVVPSIIFLMFFNMGRKNGGTVPGATDNLSASALAVAMCRFLGKNPAYIPTDTEIRLISFGSEEAGVRGAQRPALCR